MSNSFMSPLPTFTLESLVTNGQWTAAQNTARKKADPKPRLEKKNRRSTDRSDKPGKSAA